MLCIASLVDPAAAAPGWLSRYHAVTNRNFSSFLFAAQLYSRGTARRLGEEGRRSEIYEVYSMLLPMTWGWNSDEEQGKRGHAKGLPRREV